LSWGLYDNLDEIKEKVRSFLEEFLTETIASIVRWEYILSTIATVAQFWRIGINCLCFNSSDDKTIIFATKPNVLRQWLDTIEHRRIR
jgi:hypothetical protein